MAAQFGRKRIDSMTPTERAAFIKRARTAYLDHDMPIKEWQRMYRVVESEALATVTPEQRHRVREMRQALNKRGVL